LQRPKIGTGGQGGIGGPGHGARNIRVPCQIRIKGLAYSVVAGNCRLGQFGGADRAVA
jgi:hypothetical protein